MMQHAAKKATAVAASVVTIGVSSLFLGVGAASAAPTCSNGGTLISSNVCELRITTVGATTVTPTADMSKLEVLLVGGGGNGSDSSQNYGSGGGGGEVTVVGFGSDTSTAVHVVVGAAAQPSTATQGATTATARAGVSATTNSSGGASGNGNRDFYAGSASAPSSGGGAGASPTDPHNGGDGATVASVAPTGSLFTGNTECYGGGGAIGIFGGAFGTATCGAGYATSGPTHAVPVAAIPNTGGGGAGGGIAADSALRAGASGLAVLRWVALDQVTVTFSMNGHGAAVASQTFYEGGTAAQPADPSASGQIFNGWFMDAALTVPADFTVPFAASTTLYASWSAVSPPATAPVAAGPARVLPPTGGSVDPIIAGIGLGALGVGAVLLGLRARIRKSN